MGERGFSLGNRIKAFGFAIAGMIRAIKTQHALWIQLTVAVIVICLGFYLKISNADWRWLSLAITMVLAVETMNTAIEFLADAVTKDRHPLIGQAKDIAAGAVLISAIGAAAIGTLTFWPYLF
jgi:diacylglycerol kinase (ATP)